MTWDTDNVLESDTIPQTFFASPGRANEDDLLGEIDFTNNNPLLKSVLSLVGSIALVVNPHRQIVGVNTILLDTLGLDDPETILGLRPGEAMNCIHCDDHPNGCGTSEFCRGCGAVCAILASQDSNTIQEGDCLLTIRKNGKLISLEFRARACPLHLDGGEFTLIFLQDISDEKRREALEQIFFHDIRNTLSGLIGYTDLLIGTMTNAAQKDLGGCVHALALRLADEIQTQHDLVRLEHGHYTPNRVMARPSDILKELQELFTQYPIAAGKHMRIDGLDVDDQFLTEKPQLHRVLVNIVKNAFEACPIGDEIHIRSLSILDTVYFHVWNRQAIDEDVASHIFQRYFSTSGQPGRGLGTYSMKLITEQCLQGEVSFSSSVEKGTTFTLKLPRHPQ